MAKLMSIFPGERRNDIHVWPLFNIHKLKLTHTPVSPIQCQSTVWKGTELSLQFPDFISHLDDLIVSVFVAVAVAAATSIP